MAVSATHPGRPGAIWGARAVAGLEAVDPDAWDGLVPPGSGGLRHAFLRAWERCELAGLTSRPLVLPAPDGTGVAAAAAAYRYDLDLVGVHQLLPGRLLAAVRRLWPRLMIARVLELGAPVAAVPPLLLAPDIDQRQAAGAILDAALAESAAAGAGFTIVQDQVAPTGPVAEALRARGFAQLRTLPTTVLEQDFGSFDEYLGALRSRYRNRTRRILRQSRQLRVERVRDFSALAPEFTGLWRLVHNRATETKREILAEPFFTQAATVPETAALVLRRPDGSIAAFGLVLEDAPWLHFLQCGFAVQAGRDEAAYFRLMLEVVRAGIDGGFRLIHLGATTLGPKLDLGAAAVPLAAWIRHRNPVINLGCQAVARRSRAQALPAPRAVFTARG